MNRKKALIFDLDDTLYDCNYHNNTASVEVACRDAAKRLLGLPYSQVREVFDQARESVKAEILGDQAAQHNRMLYFQRMLEELGFSPVSYCLELYDSFWNDFLQRIRPYPGAVDFLRKWKKQGGGLAICTDMTVHIQHRKLRSLGLDQLVDVLVTSEEVGEEKPSPAIYERTLRKLSLVSSEPALRGIDQKEPDVREDCSKGPGSRRIDLNGLVPEDVIFIGDSYEKDVLGPIRYGMNAIWYLDGDTAVVSEEKRKMAEEQGITVVTSYSELGEILL